MRARRRPRRSASALPARHEARRRPETRHVILVTATPHTGKEDAFRVPARLSSTRRSKDLPDDLSGERNRRAPRTARPTFRPAPPRRHRALPRHRHPVSRARAGRGRPTTSRPSTGGCSTRRSPSRARAIATGRRRQPPPARPLVGRARAAALARLEPGRRGRDAAQPRRQRGDPTVDEADEIGRRTVLDQTDDEDAEGMDVAPGAAPRHRGRRQREQRNPWRRWFRALAKEADALAGANDTKLQAAIKLVDELRRRRVQPDRLLPLHRDRRLRRRAPTRASVQAPEGTGRGRCRHRHPRTRPSANERVAELAAFDRRVLVATDCLSEGINLQEHFDAVVHYDLAWNPTRHEQREGRVDRYGQRADRPGGHLLRREQPRSTESCSRCCSESTSGSAKRWESPSPCRPTPRP